MIHMKGKKKERKKKNKGKENVTKSSAEFE